MPLQEQRLPFYRFGPFEVYLETGELLKNGRRVHLQRKPFEILAALLEQSGKLVSRESLRQRLWPADTFVDFDNGLNTALSKLREALGDNAAKPSYIETSSCCQKPLKTGDVQTLESWSMFSRNTGLPK